jgi:hypothetical protein
VIEQSVAKAFVTQHHYSGTFPAARLSVGLFTSRTPRLVGACVFAVPMNQAVVPRHLGVPADQGAELSRLVLLDWVPGNAESWFVARAFRALRSENQTIRGVVSYCDPVPRTKADGSVLLSGHVGTVYQSLNASFKGRSSARTLLMNSEGRVISDRALSKVRCGESGAGYAEQQLVSSGAPPRRRGEHPSDWVDRVRRCGVFRSLRHPGNLVYVFPLVKDLKKLNPVNPALYPKRLDLASALQVLPAGQYWECSSTGDFL